MNTKRVTIPQSKLGTQLAQAEAIKTELTELLRDLESKATGRTPTKPGAWRHKSS